MSNTVSWQVELAVKPGALVALQMLTAEMVESTRHEPGVVCYERFVNQDSTIVHFINTSPVQVGATGWLPLRMRAHALGKNLRNAQLDVYFASPSPVPLLG